jgi:hypothetical protein
MAISLAAINAPVAPGCSTMHETCIFPGQSAPDLVLYMFTEERSKYCEAPSGLRRLSFFGA